MTEPHDAQTEYANQQPQAPAPAANPYANGNNPFATPPQPGSAPAAPGAVWPNPQQPANPAAPQAKSQHSAAQPPANVQPGQTVSPAQPQPPANPQPEQQQPADPQPNAQRSLQNVQQEAPVVPGFSKAVWFSAGFLLGLIGMLLIYVMNLYRPRPIRREILRYSAIGMVAGALLDMIILGAAGFGTGAGLAGGMPGFAGSTAATPTTGGIF